MGTEDGDGDGDGACIGAGMDAGAGIVFHIRSAVGIRCGGMDVIGGVKMDEFPIHKEGSPDFAVGSSSALPLSRLLFTGYGDIHSV